MTPSSPRSEPHGRQPDEHGEQSTQPLRPVSGQQRYGQRRHSAQQPRYDRHSGGRRNLRQLDRTAVATGIVAVAALLVAGAGAWLITKDSESGGGSAAPSSTAPPAPGGPVDESIAGPTGDVPGAAVDAKVGDCIKVNKAGATDAVIETIRCAKPEAVYRVGVRKQGRLQRCPGENYVSYTERGLLLCLTLNAKEGQCFQESEEQDARVACDSSDASYRVTRIVRGTQDSGECGENSADALTYPRPPLTICREAVT